MTISVREFEDIGALKFRIPDRFQEEGLMGCMVYERGTRSFSSRLFRAGYRTYGDLNDRTVQEIIRTVPTTRPNFDRVVMYLKDVGVQLT